MRSVDELAVDLLRRGSPLRVKARGGSMTPFVRDGDVALVEPVAPTDVGIGDVICYETPSGALRLHRLIGRDRRGVVARGDALTSVEVVDRARLLGKVVAVERRGTITRFDTRLARWRNRAVAVLSPCWPPLVMLVQGLRSLRRVASRG